MSVVSALSSMHVKLIVEAASLPFNIAALPDLTARDAMFAMTSGRASKMMRRTPIGHVTRVNSKPSSSFVLKVTLPTD